MLVKKPVIRKEVKRTNEGYTRKKRIMIIFNLKNKTGK